MRQLEEQIRVLVEESAARKRKRVPVTHMTSQTSTPAMVQQGGKLSQSFHVKYFLRFTFTAIAKFKPFWIYIILLLKQL